MGYTGSQGLARTIRENHLGSRALHEHAEQREELREASKAGREVPNKGG